MRKKVEIILLGSEEEYRQEYLDVFVKNGNFNLWDIPVEFDPKAFGHIFFEPSSESSKKDRFSKRRAKKMYFIKAMLEGEIDLEIMYEPEKDTFAVFSAELDCVMYLRNRKGSGKFQVCTFFDFGRDHEKMCMKQKRKCVSITKEQLKARIN